MHWLISWMRSLLLALVARPELAELERLRLRAQRHQEAAAQWRELALRDPLTGLPNRTAVQQFFGLLCERAERAGRALGVLVVDVNGLKAINDALGHEAGDLLIQRVGEVLHAPLRPYDIVFRWGGDEFLVVVQNVDITQLETVAWRMIEHAHRTPLEISGTPFALSLAIGGVSGHHGLDPDALFRQADEAEQAAKLVAHAGLREGSPPPIIRPYRPDH